VHFLGISRDKFFSFEINRVGKLSGIGTGFAFLELLQSKAIDAGSGYR
jgi:hypothetical protein